MGLNLIVDDVRKLAEMRRLLADFARCAGSRADDLILAANELATNSLLYAGGACRVVGTYPADGVVRLEVTDRGGSPFELPTAAVPASSTCGRGLYIVRAIASRCGTIFDARSTQVWLEIDVPD